jgi:hypothetical protein
MSESERLIRARIARLTELLAQLDEYIPPSLMMSGHTPLTRIPAQRISLPGTVW